MSTLTTHTTASRDSHSIGLCKFNTTSNAIEVSDGTNWQVYNPDTATGWSGSNNYSLNFDGTDDQLRSSSVVTSSAQQGTISAWIKTTNPSSGFIPLFSISNNNSGVTNEWFAFQVDNLGNLELITNNSGTVETTQSSFAIDNGNWRHVVATSDGTSRKLFIDGSEDTSATGTNTGTWIGDLSTKTACTIGGMRRSADTVNSFFNGNIDELAVWDSALSASQVTNIYKGESDGGSGGTNGTPGSLLSFSPKAWWRMGDGAEANSGTTVYDMSSFSNDMTIVNATSGTNTAGAAYQSDTP
jgi:hypothetical protein